MKIAEIQLTRDVRAATCICFLVALFEGIDIQSMGVAAPRLVPAFGLTPGQIASVMSASTLGLMIGAAIGGWISDRVGRKIVLIVSMAVLAVFSLATTVAPTYSLLLVIRVLAGLGLGGAFPNLIALISEIAPPKMRVTPRRLIYCGLPVGGAVAGALAAWWPSEDWRLVFYVGGLGPLLLIPVLMKWLPHGPWLGNSSRQIQASYASEPRDSNLLGARTSQTVLLWTSYFFTLLAVYLLLNWLPSLLVANGYSHTQAAVSSIVLNVGAVIGSIVLGKLTDRGLQKATLIFTYAGMTAALLVLAAGQGETLFAGAFLAGFFVIGGQLVLYAIAPTIYPEHLRGTGIGAAVAVGRIGSILGPLQAGLLLSMGTAPGYIPLAALPGLLIAFAAASSLISKQALMSKQERAPA
jgi:AAHS family 3-hydroxyphenylpropionic acid transporter